MKKIFSSDPKDLIAAFGPAIRQCCYEVGSEFLEYFPGLVKTNKSKLFFDLAGAAVFELGNSGVLRKHIYDSSLCTSCRNDEFFSYRKEGVACGRILSVVQKI